MITGKTLRAMTLLGLGYLILAELALRFARFDAISTFVWPASALLTAWLQDHPPRRWLPPLAACALASIVGTGLWGHGWQAAPGLALAQLAEPALAALMLRQLAQNNDHPDSLGWLWRFLCVAAVAAPMLGAALGTLYGHVFADSPLSPTFRNMYISHALGLVIFLPCFTTLFRNGASFGALLSNPQKLASSAAFLVVMAAVAGIAFNNGAMPLLFLPILVLAASIVWAEPVTQTLMYIVLTVIGCISVAHGNTPLAQTHLPMAQQMQYLQIYLAATVLCIMPIAGAVQRLHLLLAQLRESEARYRLLADNSTDIIMSTDAQGIIRFVSPSVLQLAQYHPAELIGQPAQMFIAPDHRQRVHETHVQAIASRGQTHEIEFLGLSRYTDPRWFDSHMRAVVGENGEVECVVSIVRDLSERKKFETALTLAALTDPLTGLPNRRQFMEAMASCIAAGKPGCVAIIDLDHFKKINDRFGHAAGDEVLKTFARVARQGLRASDTLARIGGEEFALLLPGASLDVGERICGRLGSALSQAITRFGTDDIAITTSIGLARLGDNAEAAMHEADRALYEAKASGRDRLAIAA